MRGFSRAQFLTHVDSGLAPSDVLRTPSAMIVRDRQSIVAIRSYLRLVGSELRIGRTCARILVDTHQTSALG